VSTRRQRELWRHGESGETFAVEVEDGRVLAAEGPVDPDEVDRLDRIWAQPAIGRTPAFTKLAAELQRRSDDFERLPYPAP